MSYEILPAERDWPEWVEEFARALAHKPVNRDEEAALSLLFRDPALTFATEAFADRYVSGFREGVTVEWQILGSHLESGKASHPIVVTEETRALLHLACSLADEYTRVHVGRTLAKLSEPLRVVVFAALRYASERAA